MAENKQKPVILLSHGAWHQPLHYRSLIDGLREKGFTVLAPPLATAGYDDSVVGKTQHDDIKRLHDALLPLLDEGRTAIAIGHSYGSVPVTGAIKGHSVAERANRGLGGGIVSAIYIASTPFFQTGVSMYEAGGNQWRGRWFHDVDVGFDAPGSLAGPLLSLQDTRLPLKLEIAKDVFYSDLDQAVKDEAGLYLVHQSRSPFEAPITCTPVELNVPKKFVLCALDKAVPKDIQAHTAKEWGCTPLEVDAGHSPWLKKEALEKIVDLVVKEAVKA